MEDDIIAELEALEEDDGLMQRLREQRMRELQDEMDLIREMKDNRHGQLLEVTEKDFLEISTKTKYCIAHFEHQDFRRCQVLNKHLVELAKKHFKTKFVKVDVTKAGFLVEKLKIQTLPCLICFEDGITVDRIVGFEELGNTDNFSTRDLEKRLSKTNVLKPTQDKQQVKKTSILGFPEDY